MLTKEESCSLVLWNRAQSQVNFFIQPRNIKWLLFSFEGRTNRGQFWVSIAYVIILAVSAFGVVLVLALVFDAGGEDGETDITKYAFVLLTLAIYFIVLAAVFIKRLHDLGAPGGAVVPLIYVPDIAVRMSERTFAGTNYEIPLLVIGLIGLACGWGMCGFRSGEPEPNEYGVSGEPQGTLIT